MQRAHNASILGGVVVNLGADYCAEHEWGIKGICEHFGIPIEVHRKALGIEGRTITEIPTGLYLVEGDNKIALVFDGYLGYQDEHRQLKVGWKDLSSELKGEGPKLITAWDEKSFGLVAFTDEDCNFLRKLHQAFIEKDVAIWLGGGGVFQNAGLCIGIASQIPEENKKTMASSDADRLSLKEAATKTGIEKRLTKAGLKWFALSPRWTPSKDKERTTQPVVFWLNPMDQQNVNYGWFTVEELDQWIKGIGPIPKVGRLGILVVEGKTVDAKRKFG